MQSMKNPWIHESSQVNQIPFEFEHKELLRFLEDVNPCGQRYFHDGTNVICTYRLKLNLLQFTSRRAWTVPVRIVGIPLSLAQKGYDGDSAGVASLIRSLKGFTLVLNGTGDLPLPMGSTLGRFELDLHYKSFEEYQMALRSSYRRRVQKALLKREGFRIKRIAPKDFDETLYGLYLAVYDASESKLERLDITYFQGLDADITVFEERGTGRRIGFLQTLLEGNRLTFLFAGFQRQDVLVHDLYWNLLLEVVRQGIAKGACVIDFGQTAEESKRKLGCREVPLYLHVHHKNPILHGMLRRILPRVTYKKPSKQFRVFKEQHENYP